jgi:hypothetical protein
VATNFLVVANFGTGFLALPVSTTATTLTLQPSDMANFPSTFPYRVVVDSEIMEVTAKDDANRTLTVIRAREGTVATTHLALSLVSIRLTAEGVQRIYDAIHALESSVGKIQVRVDEGLDVGERPRLHFLSGFGIDIAAADDSTNNEVRLTIHNDRTIDTITGSSTLTLSHNIVLVNASGGPATITLPSAASIAGKRFVVKKIDFSANAVTIQGVGGQTIDGSSTISITAPQGVRTIVSDGANWKVIGN